MPFEHSQIDAVKLQSQIASEVDMRKQCDHEGEAESAQNSRQNLGFQFGDFSQVPVHPSPPIQRQVGSPESSLAETAYPENNTGLPDKLKSGVEALSGFSLDDVQVHYNSSKPADINALAYAQGTDIHLAPGQEKHLPHEAWHVVQQAQGRVQPTHFRNGALLNDEPELEIEADYVGKAISNHSLLDKKLTRGSQLNSVGSSVAQLVPEAEIDPEFVNKLRSEFKPPVPDRNKLGTLEYAQEFASQLGNFHSELMRKAAKRNYKVLARFYSKDKQTDIEHPGVNSWAHMIANQKEYAVDYEEDEVDEIASDHMQFGHDVGESKVKASPLISGTDDIKALIDTDSPYNSDRGSGLHGGGGKLKEKAREKNPLLALKQSTNDKDQDAAGSSSALSRPGKFVSDRIVALIWGHKDLRSSKTLNSAAPVAVANHIAFIVVPSEYKYLYTPERIDARKSDCCSRERENTLYSQKSDIRNAVIGEIENPFPFMQSYKSGDQANARAKYIDLLRKEIVEPNTYINWSKMTKEERIELDLLIKKKEESTMGIGKN